jgi:SAM-dependent methyltransferase
MAELEDPWQAQRYQRELPDDRSNFAEAWKLLEAYSHIPPDEIDAHVIAVVSRHVIIPLLTLANDESTSQREKAFKVFHYGCIGRWRFLDLYITKAPEYPDIINRVKGGEKLLDLGCCFGHILRQLAFDGAPAANLTGADLRPEFIELGYELFRDKDTFGAHFVTGDILNPTDAGLATLDNKIDIVHTASFFHLFGWDDQVKIGERVVRFFKPGAKAVILGRQSARREPVSVEVWRESGEKKYHHNVATLQHLWDVIGEKTGTKWKVTGQLFDSTVPGYSKVFDAPVAGKPRTTIRFAVFKVD